MEIAAESALETTLLGNLMVANRPPGVLLAGFDSPVGDAQQMDCLERQEF
jgi:hypothetical protein